MFGQENSKIKQRFLQLFFDNHKKKNIFTQYENLNNVSQYN